MNHLAHYIERRLPTPPRHYRRTHGKDKPIGGKTQWAVDIGLLTWNEATLPMRVAVENMKRQQSAQ